MSIMSLLMNRAVGLIISGLRNRNINTARSRKNPARIEAAAMGERASCRSCKRATAPNAMAIVTSMNAIMNNTAAESSSVSFSAAVSLALSMYRLMSRLNDDLSALNLLFSALLW